MGKEGKVRHWVKGFEGSVGEKYRAILSQETKARVLMYNEIEIDQGNLTIVIDLPQPIRYQRVSKGEVTELNLLSHLSHVRVFLESFRITVLFN